MEITLSNTLKNASVDFDPNSSKIRKQMKRVIFSVDRNNYYEPKQWREEEAMREFMSKRKAEIDDSESFAEKKLD